MKIRCRSRRTSSSTAASRWRPSQRARPLVRSPDRASRRPTCPSVPGFRSSSLLTGSPDRVSAPFGARAPGPVSGRLSEPTAWRRRPSSSRFPVALSAAGVRFSGIRFPPRSWAPLAVGLPTDTSRPDPDGVTAFRTHELRPGWVPSLPRGRRCSSRPPRRLLTGACRFAAASPSPRATPITGLLTRHQRGFTQFTRPVFPSPVAARMERGPFGFPPGFAPHRHP